eukprot:scaffold88600_cov29-Tisochrysis_lutea.AAC.2
MAAKLLRTMRTCCIYKSNGCPWKGRVKELGVHHRECRFAVSKVRVYCSADPSSARETPLHCIHRT